MVAPKIDVAEVGAAFRVSWLSHKREIERLGGNAVEVVHPRTGEVRLSEACGPPSDCTGLGLAVSQDWDPVPGGLCERAWPGKAGPVCGPDKGRKPRCEIA